MSNLDLMKEKILEEARAEADAVRRDAKEILDDERAHAMQNVQEEVSVLMQRAHAEVPLIQERIAAEAEREKRNALLTARQAEIGRAFEMAEQKLKELAPEPFEATLTRYLSAHPMDGGDVLEVPRGRAGQTGGVKAVECEDLSSGFRIRRAGVNENYDFVEVLHYLRSDLEQEVIRELTEGEA